MSTHSHQHTENAYSVKSYSLGFILSIIFTIIPFYVVKSTDLSNLLMILIISVSAIIQLFIQLFFFMHINMEKKPRYNNGSLLFTIFTTLIFVIGTIWIMFSLSYRMHPKMPHLDNHATNHSDADSHMDH